MDIIGKRSIFLSLSGILVVASIIAMLVIGFRQAIDFAGGTLWDIRFDAPPAQFDIVDILREEYRVDALVTQGSAGDTIVRLPQIDETQRSAFFRTLQERFGNASELSFQSIGPSVGNEVRQNALFAIVLVVLGISLYIAFAFRKVSRPISSWKYGVVTLVTLLHDIAIPAGLFALFGKYLGAEVDTNFVVALLVVMGFSVHDTIVVFDRIRENIFTARDRNDLTTIVNKSVNETMARSVNTSLTLMIVLLTLYVLGPETLKFFVLTMLVGVFAGTYSSIFVASPLVTAWHDWTKK